MPRIKDLEAFKRDLAALSREAETLAAWGEQPEYPPPPSAETVAPPQGPTGKGLAARAAARLSGAGNAPASSPSAEAPPDFADLLADLDLEGDAPPAAEPGVDEELAELLEPAEDASSPSPLPASGPGDGFGSGEGFSLPEDFALPEDFNLPPPGDGAEPEAGETPPDFDLAAFAEPEPEAFAEAATGAEAGIAGAAEEGAAAGEELSDFDLAAFAEPEADAEAVPEAEPPAETGGAADAGFPELSGFPELLPEESSSGEPGFALPEESSSAGPGLGDDFSIPDFGEESAAGPGPSGAASPASEVEDFSLPSFELGGEEESPPAAAEASPAEGEATLPGPSGIEALGDFGEGDAFDSFSFDAGGETLSGEALDRELASLGEGAAEDSTFSLDEGWGEGFAEPVAPGAASAPAAPAPGGRRPGPPPRADFRAGTAAAGRPSAPRAAGEEKVREVSLSEAQVDRLQDSLLALPLNVRVAVEEAVANEAGTEAQRSKLVWMLVEGARVEDIAALAGRALKRRVHVPPGHEKGTGAALEAERGSLRWALVHTVLPIARTAVLVLAAVGALAFLGWRYIYRPLAANALFRQGYALISEDRFAEAEESFERARGIREYRSWYYRYAEAYDAKRQDIRAGRKYKDLLDRWPGETKAALDWARLELRQAKYKDAAEILNRRILERKYLDKDALLLLGDVYLAWADEDPKYFEEARRSFAALIQEYGSEEAWEERMLLYFMRSGAEKQALRLGRALSSVPENGLKAATLAEFGGYLIDTDNRGEARPVLDQAVAKDRGLAEAHYQLARLLSDAGVPEEERKALDNAVAAFRRRPALDRRALPLYLDALIRRGDFRFARGEHLAAEEDFAAAAAEYVKAVELGRARPGPGFARAWYGLARVAFGLRDDLDATLSLLERAERDGFDSVDARYMRGYSLYRKGDFGRSLEQFYRAGREGGESPYLLYAYGNALFSRSDWFAAEGYYRRTVDFLSAELERLELPEPQRRPSHAEIVELLMVARNNLGVALYRAGDRIGDPRMRARGMAEFSESARLFDALERDQKSFTRPEAKNLGFLNMDFALHPKRGIAFAIYADIPRSMDYPRD